MGRLTRLNIFSGHLERLDRLTLSEAPLLLCEVYPFVRKRTRKGPLWASLQIKLMILLGREVTFAGSTLLLDPYAKQLYQETKLFFREGLVIPDLRTHADSFTHLLRIYGQDSSQSLLNHAFDLDNNVKRVINFDPTEVSDLYSRDLNALFDSLISTASGKAHRALHAAQDAISKQDGPLALKTVKMISNSLVNGADFRKASEFLYCVAGSEIVGADLLLPRCYSNAQSGMDAIAKTDDIELEAVNWLFRYFAVDVNQIVRLSPRQILDLRGDQRVMDGVKSMDGIIGAARTGERRVLQRDLAGVVQEIQARIQEVCQKEKRLGSKASAASDIVLDYGVPMSSLFKKGIMRLEHWLARSKHFGLAARSFTPLTTFVSVVQDELRKDRAESPVK